MKNEAAKPSVFPVVALLLGAFVLRFLFSWNFAFNMDEAWTIRLAGLPLSEIIQGTSKTPAMPLGYILLRPWVAVSTNPVWLQLYPILFGVAGVFLAFLIADRLFGRGTALLAGSLNALSPALVQYSHIVRYPIFLTFFALAATALALRVAGVHGPREPASPLPEDTAAPPGNGALVDWPLMSALLVACIYLHYFSVFAVIGLTVFFVLFSFRWKPLLKWALVLAPPAAAFIAWLPNMINLRNNVRVLPFAQTLAQLVTLKKMYLYDIVIQMLLGVFADIHKHTATHTAMKLAIFLFLLGVAIAALRGLFSPDKAMRRSLRALTAIVGATLVSGLVVTTIWSGPLFTTQYFLFAVPVFLILLSALIANEKSRLLRGALLFLCIPILVVPLVHTYKVYASHPNAADAIRYIRKNMRPRDVLLVRPSAVTSSVAFYIADPPRIVAIPKPFDALRYRYEDVYINLDREDADSIIAQLAGAPRIWFLDVDSRFEFDSRHYMETFLGKCCEVERAFRFVESYPTYGSLVLYRKRQP